MRLLKGPTLPQMAARLRREDRPVEWFIAQLEATHGCVEGRWIYLVDHEGIPDAQTPLCDLCDENNDGCSNCALEIVQGDNYSNICVPVYRQWANSYSGNRLPTARIMLAELKRLRAALAQVIAEKFKEELN
jgi:hypothetical protein